MFGIGLPEMLVVGAIALIFIGPDQLPTVARTVGRFLNDLRRSSDEIKSQFRDQTDEFKKVFNDPPPIENSHEEYKPLEPHQGDNLAELSPEKIDEHGNVKTADEEKSEEKKKG